MSWTTVLIVVNSVSLVGALSWPLLSKLWSKIPAPMTDVPSDDLPVLSSDYKPSAEARSYVKLLRGVPGGTPDDYLRGLDEGMTKMEFAAYLLAKTANKPAAPAAKGG